MKPDGKIKIIVTPDKLGEYTKRIHLLCELVMELFGSNVEIWADGKKLN